MILLDFSAVMHADIAVNLKQNCGTKTDINYLRHLILNSLRMYNKKFSHIYGELVLCMDSKDGYWRREVFPNYKAGRKKARIDSGIDWKSVFEDVNTITEEIEKYLPYKTVRVSGLEADDVIAILAKNADKLEETNLLGDMKHDVVIISNDKDFAQLHSIRWVKQYKPRTGNVVKVPNPDFALTDLILHGDKADGIPNIRSDINTFVTEGIRQKAVTSTFIKKFLDEGEASLTEFEKERFAMNRQLISFEEIPLKYTQLVLDEFKKEKVFSRAEFFNYCCAKGLRELVEKIQDF